MALRTLRCPNDETVDLDLEEDLDEEGGIHTEEVVADWLDHVGDAGLTAAELAARSDLTEAEAHARLVNLFENDLATVEDCGPSPGIQNGCGRFFALPTGWVRETAS